ncbi:hypothetical protein [Shewanella sp. CG18_big_fil_WC_8_21_14_2_50_42_11]|nr:hypothetical protein [Shewanella sp. CG18_big_fil_WC_8_21_14_2_50_42_11]
MTLAYSLGLIAAFMIGGIFGVLSIAIFNINKPDYTEEEHF